MIQSLIDSAKLTSPDSASSAISDWAVIGIQTGNRSSEWCQAKGTLFMSTTATFTLNIDGSPTAFLAEDIWLFSSTKRPLAFTSGLTWLLVQYVDVCWRYQKNNDNGQVITYTRNFKNPECCVIEAFLRVLDRHTRLSSDPSIPLAISLDGRIKSSSVVSYITNALVTKFLQMAATAAHGITNKKDLKKFSPHSIRVGACVLLDIHGKTPGFIKKRLRWRSDAYLDYLRNVVQLAHLHSDVIDHSITTTTMSS